MDKQSLINLKIGNVIVHDIPKHRKGDASVSPEYSSIPVSLDSELSTFFKKKIIGSLSGHDSLKVCFDSFASSLMPDILNEIIGAESFDFVELSQDAAKDLFDNQTGQASSGIFVALQGKVNRMSLIVILKLERDEGARLVRDNSKETFDIESVKNLMLTDKTRLLKSALFFKREDFGIDYDGFVVDSQRTMFNSKGIASFFLTYLGCKLYSDSRKQTMEFFDSTYDYVSKVSDPERRTIYFDSLLSYFNSNNDTISPQLFAMEYLKIEDQDDFRRHISATKIDLNSAIKKDNDLIASRLKKIKLVLDNGITIYAINGDINEKALIENLPGNAVRVEIKSKITNIST